MIRQKEIATIAEQQGVAKTTIDKDWALGHFVDAIFSLPECRDQLVFKGGTCLKKCYFPNYRFSEDLDFTVVNPDFRLDEKLLEQIMQVRDRANRYAATSTTIERTQAPGTPYGFCGCR